jgi:tetratricopeptide (TPR) repeat protein
MAHYFRGESKKADEVGKFMLDYGQKISDLRFTTMGHSCVGFGHYVAGDFTSAMECFKRAIQVSKDTIYSNAARLLLGMSFVADGQFQEAEKILEEISADSKDFSFEFLGTAARSFTGIILMAKGNLSQGEKIVIDMLQVWQRNGSRYRYAAFNNTLGKFYLQIVQRTGPKSLSFLVKNIGFLAKTLPFADRKAEASLNEAIKVSKEIGAKGILGQAYLDLSLLHKAKNRTDQARECVSEAIQLFEKCEADVYLKQARDVLASLG